MIADDDVVEDFDLHHLAGADQIAGDFDVSFRWRGISGRVIVLCDAPVYVESVVGGTTLPAGPKGKGVLWKEMIPSKPPTFTRLSAR